jgi:hypothetical protein
VERTTTPLRVERESAEAAIMSGTKSKDMKPFDNEDRSRYYGLRVGDTVKPKAISGGMWKEGISEVVNYCPGDNNRVMIKSKTGIVTDWVAEWCEIVERVEDKTNNSSMKILDKIIEKFERKIEKEKSKSDDKKNYQKIDYLKESLDELQLLTHVIVLNNVEQRSKLTRVLSAEHLIQQLPKEHQGRNSWLLNYGVEEESIQMRVSRNLLFDETTQSCELAGQ